VYELFCYFTSYLLNVNGCADILSHGHGISSVVVIQLTLALKQVLYISNPTLEFLTWM
jgi:hypothetical protein